MQEEKTIKMFYDIPNAAKFARIPLRRFRRMLEDNDIIRVFQIGRKFFMLGSELEIWLNTRRKMD